MNAEQNGKIPFRQVPSNQSNVHALRRPHRLSSTHYLLTWRDDTQLIYGFLSFDLQLPDRLASHSGVTMGGCDDSGATRSPGRGRPGQLPAAAFPPGPNAPTPPPTPLPALPLPGTGTTRPWRPVSDISPVSADKRPWASRPRGALRRPGPRRRGSRRLPPCCRSCCRPGAARASPTWPRCRLLNASA